MISLICLFIFGFCYVTALELIRRRHEKDIEKIREQARAFMRENNFHFEGCDKATVALTSETEVTKHDKRSDAFQ